MKFLKAISILICISFLAIGCGGGNGDDSGNNGGNESLVGTWEMTDIQGASLPLEPATFVLTDSTYTLTVEGDCEVSGIYTSDGSSIVVTSQSQTGNTDSFCDYHEQPHSVTYTVTSTTLIITDGDVVITGTRQ